MLVPASEPTIVAIASVKRMRLRPGNAPVRVHQPGALGDRDQRADIVEQVDEQEDEQDLEQAEPVLPTAPNTPARSSLKAVPVSAARL